MLAPCEVATKCILPVVRAMIARELMTQYTLKQIEVANLLGVSQPAISLYSRQMRGKAIDIENDIDIKRLIQNLTTSLAEERLSQKEFIPRFCEICRAIRAKGLMCKLHKAFDPAFNIEKCDLCSTIATTCIR